MSDHTSLLSDKHAIWPGKCPMIIVPGLWFSNTHVTAVDKIVANTLLLPGNDYILCLS